MTVSRRARPTLDEFLRFPELKPPLEFEEGRVTQKVSPNLHHGSLALHIGSLLDRFGRPRQLAVACVEVRITFGNRSYVPDVSLYRWERIPRDKNGDLLLRANVLPDAVVEILSPEQTVAALSRRCRWYVDNGIPIALLVDSERRILRLFRPDGFVAVLRGEDRIDLDDLLPGLELTVREIFAVLSPQASE
jgi:Uma2 family endonuclease